MNAHDCERIKGLLEDLGLGEALAPGDADVIVFNTCTIREKPDTKLAAYIGDARRRSAPEPDTVIAVGGCYVEAQRDRLFTLYPDVDVAFGPGTISHLGEWLGAGGFGVPRGAFRIEGGAGSPRGCRRTASELPGVGVDLHGLQLEVRLLHRPRGARAGGQPAARAMSWPR